MVGVHTPEFPFERDVDNVRRAVEEMSVALPGRARQPTTRSGDAFANHYWPALYIADAEGGSGTTSSARAATRSASGSSSSCCAKRARASTASSSRSTPEGFEAQADWANLDSPETYLGYEQAPELRLATAVDGRALRACRIAGLNQWALVGRLDDRRRRGACSNGAEGRIAFRFHARDVHLVMGPGSAGAAVPFRVLLDGEPPGDAHGLDVDEDGRGTLSPSSAFTS